MLDSVRYEDSNSNAIARAPLVRGILSRGSSYTHPMFDAMHPFVVTDISEPIYYLTAHTFTGPVGLSRRCPCDKGHKGLRCQSFVSFHRFVSIRGVVSFQLFRTAPYIALQLCTHHFRFFLYILYSSTKSRTLISCLVWWQRRVGMGHNLISIGAQLPLLPPLPYRRCLYYSHLSPICYILPSHPYAIG